MPTDRQALQTNQYFPSRQDGETIYHIMEVLFAAGLEVQASKGEDDIAKLDGCEFASVGHCVLRRGGERKEAFYSEQESLHSGVE